MGNTHIYFTHEEINNAYNHYKVLETGHMQKIRYIERSSNSELYYYKSIQCSEYIVNIICERETCKVNFLAHLGTTGYVTIDNKHSYTYPKNVFMEMIRSDYELVCLSKRYTPTIEPVIESVIEPAIIKVNIFSTLDYDDEIIDDKKSYIDDALCGICMVNKKQICLDCGHLFCNACTKQLKEECFICREPYTNLIKIYT
jgi:hypothetical protein